MKNRFALCLAASLLTLSSVPFSAQAAHTEDILPISESLLSSEIKDEPTTEVLEKIIKIVKPRITVPSACTEFQFDYSGKSLYSEATWMLTWRDPDTGAYVRAECDESGNLISYYFYNPETNKRADSFPENAKEAYLETAKSFLARTAPEARLSFVKAYDASGLYRPTYRYEFVRSENGLEIPSQNATVMLDAFTGAVTDCMIHYNYDTAVRDVQNPITAEKAKELLHESLKMELQYTTNRTYNEDGTTDEKAVLVYRPSGTNYSVDAVTGEIYTERTEWGSSGGAGGDMKNESATADTADEADEDYTLTEEELAGIEQLAGLIGKEEAIKKITDNTALYLDVRLDIADATLTRKGASRYRTVNQSDENESFVWNVRFGMSEREKDSADYYDYVTAYATVDAESGRILSFESTLHDAWYYEKNELEIPKKQYDEAACEKILSDFAKQNTDYFDLTRRSQLYDTNAIEVKYDENDNETERVYGAYGYRFVRVNEGLDYNDNYIVGTVDGVTGKICSFSSNWTKNLTFESPRDAISEEEAFERYCEYADVDLFYEEYTLYQYGTSEKENGDKLKNLILRLKKNPNKAKDILAEYAPDLDADKVKGFLDAADTEGLISLCAEYYGADPVSAVNFYYGTSELYTRTVTARPVYAPKKPRTYVGALTGERVTYVGSVIQPVAEGDFTDIETHWAAEYIEKLARVGVIDRTPSYRPDEAITESELCRLFSAVGLYSRRYGSDTEANGTVTRLDAVKKIIDGMNLTRAAKISGIYRTEFSDNPQIKEEDVGYLAIAYGLHIVEGDKGTATFRPDDIITRGEAAKLAYSAVSANADET